MLCEPLRPWVPLPTSLQSFLKQQSTLGSAVVCSLKIYCVYAGCVGTRAVTHVSKSEDTLWNQSHFSTLSWVQGWTLGFQVCPARTLYWLSRPISPECSSFRWSSLQMVLGFGVKRVGRSWNPGFFVICFGSSLWCYLSLQALMVSLLARRMVGFPTDRQLSLKMLPISCPQEISWFWFLFLFKNFLCFIFMCTGVSAYTNVCALRACSACWGQKRALDPPGQKSKWLWAAMWMQGIKS